MFVSLDSKPDFSCFLILQGFDLVRAELENRAATTADEVIVVPPVQFALESRLALKDQGLRKARAYQELEGSVDRRAPDARSLSADQVVKIVDRQVLVGGKKHIDDQIPARAPIQSLPFQMGFKDTGFVGKYSLH